MGQALGAAAGAAGGSAGDDGPSFLGGLFGVGGGEGGITNFASVISSPGPQMLLQLGMSFLARRKQKKEEERRLREGIEIRGSSSVDYAQKVLGRRLVETGSVVLKGTVPIKYSGVGWVSYHEVTAWAIAGRGGVGGVREIWLDEDRYRFPEDFEKYDFNSYDPSTRTAANLQRYAIKNNTEYIQGSQWADLDKWGYRGGADGNEPPSFLVTVYDGTQTEADPGLVLRGNPHLQDWSADHIGRNVVYTVMEFNRYKANVSLWDKRKFPKRISVVLDGDKVPTSEANQAVPANWEFTRNPAYLAPYIHWELPQNVDIDEAPIDWTRTKASADICAEVLSVPEATVKGSKLEDNREKRAIAGTPVKETMPRLRDYREIVPASPVAMFDGWQKEGTTAPNFVSFRVYEADGGQQTAELVSNIEISEYAARNMDVRFNRITVDASTTPPTSTTVELMVLSLGGMSTVEDDGSNKKTIWTSAAGSPADISVIPTDVNVFAEFRLLPEGSTSVGGYFEQERWNCDIAAKGSATPANLIEMAEFACDGEYFKSNGEWALDVFHAEADSGVELVDGMLAARPVLETSEQLSSRFTSLSAAWWDPNQNWKRTETPEHESPALITLEGRKLPSIDIALEAVTSFAQAWRLVLRQALREEMQEQLVLKLFHDGLRIRHGTNFKYKSEDLGISAFKRFRADEVSIGRGNVPVSVIAREEDVRIYRTPGPDEYPTYDSQGSLIVPEPPPFPCESLVATGITEAIELEIGLPDTYEEIEIWTSESAAWSHSSRQLYTTTRANKVRLDYPTGTERWFWVRNNIGGALSTRFPNDDVSHISAIAGAFDIVKRVEGECPPQDEWPGHAGVEWLDPETGKRWVSVDDPWPNALQGSISGTAATKNITYDPFTGNPAANPPTASRLTLGTSTVTWKPKLPGLPPRGLANTMFAVRGNATDTVDRAGVLFKIETGIGVFVPAGNDNFVGLTVGQSIPDTFFTDATNAVFNSLDINPTTMVASIVMRDATRGNYPAGPHLAKPGGKYTLVVRIGTTSYALPIDATDVEEPYAISSFPTGFNAAVIGLRTARRAGTTLPALAMALIDEDLWTDGTNWGDAFTLVSRTVVREFVTQYTGNDSTSPFVWQTVGDVPNFLSTSGSTNRVEVLELDARNKCFTPNELTFWDKVPSGVPKTPRPGGGRFIERMVPAGRIATSIPTPAIQTEAQLSMPDANAINAQTQIRTAAWIQTFPEEGGRAVTVASAKSLARIRRVLVSLDTAPSGDADRLLPYLASVDIENSVTMWFKDQPDAWINATLERPATAIERRNFFRLDVVEPTDDRGEIITASEFPLEALDDAPASTSRILVLQFSRAEDGTDGDDGQDGEDAEGFIVDGDLDFS